MATSVFLAHEMIIDLQSTSLDRRSKNIRVLPVIIAELELCNMGKANGSDEITLCQQTREAWVKSL
jgi:hypothetical protein